MADGQIKRGHPIIILYYARWVLLVGIVPLLRGVFSTFSFDFSFWSKGIGVDLVILAGIVVTAVLRWYFYRFTYNSRFIQQERGIFFSQKTTLPLRNITVLKSHQPLYLRPVGAVFLRADSLGGGSRKTDLNICVHKRDLDSFSVFLGETFHTSIEASHYEPKLKSVLFLSLVSINNFVGAFYLVTFVTQSGRILGEEFPQRLIGTFETLARTMSTYIPPAAAALAYFFIFTWLVGVIFTLLKYYNFRVASHSSYVDISGGLMNKHKMSIGKEHICYLNLQQNFIAHILGVFSLYISAVGCGKERQDITCVVPSARKASVHHQTSALFAGYPITKPTLRREPAGIFLFLRDPLICLGVATVVMIAANFFLPDWGDFIMFVGLMSFIPSAAFLLTRLFDYRSSGLGFSEDTLSIFYSKGFTLHNILVHKEKIVGVKINVGFIQQFSGNCDVYVYTTSEKRDRHRCRNLNHEKATQFFDLVMKTD